MARLRPLSEHDEVRFGKDSYDVRHWKVRTRVDDADVGEVHDVLVDENSRTRYLDVELSGDRHVLIPSGDARVDPDHERVELPGMDREGLGTLPKYDHRPEDITPEYSRSLTTAYDDAYAGEPYDRSDYAAGWDRERGRREQPGTRREHTGTPSERGRLARLDKLDDVKVASGQPDPRGWEVVGSGGERLGRVDHVIGDTAAMKARYLTVELDSDIASDRHVLMPVGHVDLDRDHNRVISRAVGRDRAGRLPAYEGGEIDRDYESRLTREYGEAYEGERTYDHPRYQSRELDTEEARVTRSEEELSVGKRERETGEVDVKKRVEKERVREPVETHHEEVEVERRAASGDARSSDMGDEEVRIPVREEEVVTEKKPRVKEEVVVKKRDVEDTEVVEEDVRKERVDVERKGDTETRR